MNFLQKKPTPQGLNSYPAMYPPQSFAHPQQQQAIPQQFAPYGAPRQFPVDTISYRPPSSTYSYQTQNMQNPAPYQFQQRPSVQPTYQTNPQQQQSYQSVPQQRPQMQQPMPMGPQQVVQPQLQRSAPAYIPPQAHYNYMQGPDALMQSLPPIGSTPTKKSILGLAFPQAISLGIGFGLFLLGLGSMMIGPGTPTP